jgi:2-polyprenyl-3-methyl-5-hydroxy-6-metoxy-1,4-benzoquinol methylase
MDFARLPLALLAAVPEAAPSLRRVAPSEIAAALPLDLAQRLYLYSRRLICPFDEVAREVPAEGRIVDLGCGYGIFSVQLRLQSPARDVLGIDLDARRIAAARRSPLLGHGLEFRQSDVLREPLEPCDGLVMVDLLHHLPPESGRALLATARAALRPGGRLVVKELDASARLRSAWAWLHDVAVTRSTCIHYRRREALEALLRDAGFRDVRSRPLPILAPYAHLLLTAVA